MLAQCPLEVVNRTSPYSDKTMIPKKYSKGDYDSLVTLNAALKQQLMETKRREVTYEQVLEQAFFIEDVLKNQDNPNGLLESNLIVRRTGRCGALHDSFEYQWHTKLRPKAFKLIGLVAIILSCQLVLGELIILFKFNFTLFDLIPHGTAIGKLVGYGFSLVCILYMSLCIYYGLFNIKFTSYYELHGNQQTDAFSLLYSANFLTKLAPPLCFNFLKLINVQGTAFHRMLGGLDPIPLIGEDFQKLFPATLLLLVLFNAFDLWSKLMLCLGLEDFQFAEVIDAVKIEEGKTLAKIGNNIHTFNLFRAW